MFDEAQGGRHNTAVFAALMPLRRGAAAMLRASRWPLWRWALATALLGPGCRCGADGPPQPPHATASAQERSGFDAQLRTYLVF